MRKDYRQGLGSARIIGKKYGVSATYAYQLINGSRWGHLDGAVRGSKKNKNLERKPLPVRSR
jgi:hypothetical protein